MYVLELSGVHVGKHVTLDYEFKNGDKHQKQGYLGEVRHMGKGEAWIILVNRPEDVVRSRQIGGAFRVPFDGGVEFSD